MNCQDLLSLNEKKKENRILSAKELHLGERLIYSNTKGPINNTRL